MKLTCLIVDDEPLALALLENYIAKTDFLQLKHRCKNAVQAKEYLAREKADLIFLDIHMPELSGMELSKIIDKNTRIIFTTAFDQYAVEGYKVNALDYLLKPFDYEEFFAAALKAKEWFERTPAAPEKEFIFVRSEYRQIKIMLDDVLYFEGLKDYIKIWLKDHPKAILTLLSLKALEKELPASKFMRVHRSFIIAFNKIKSIEKSQIVIGNARISIARQYKNAFQKFFSNRSVNKP
ncbi:MAG: response regulator transcription factor [Bacteroidetes bacterium]|nr:response regulator transcription factor [Bacteroidota bacterium]